MGAQLLCSDCFGDHGLRLGSLELGTLTAEKCPACGSRDGAKLDAEALNLLAHRFFVRGTLHRTPYGGAPTVQFNDHQETIAAFEPRVQEDARKISEAIGVGFFLYGPRLWMVGEIEPLKALQSPVKRRGVIDRVLSEYPYRSLFPGDILYRLRVNPDKPTEDLQYDSPPASAAGAGRLNSQGLPVLYASQDLEVCIHECRATVDDELYVATLTPRRELTILDLTEPLRESVSEFESLDLAVHMLFLAGAHSYEVSRDLAAAARAHGSDGIAFPSYFSLVRTGAMPFETAYGISVRMLEPFRERVRAQAVRNLALFGAPVADGDVDVLCKNRVIIHRAAYDLSFGPVQW